MDKFIENPKPTSLDEELTELIVKKMAENKVLKKLRQEITSTDCPGDFPGDNDEIAMEEFNNQ